MIRHFTQVMNEISTGLKYKSGFLLGSFTSSSTFLGNCKVYFFLLFVTICVRYPRSKDNSKKCINSYINIHTHIDHTYEYIYFYIIIQMSPN